MTYLTVRQIAIELGLSTSVVYNRINSYELKADKVKRGTSLYSEDKMLILKNPPTRNSKYINYVDVIKYYPLKTTVVYEIYQSKLNTQ